MRGDAVFRQAVHLLRAYLDLHCAALRPHDRGVERLVQVLLGRGDVVVELPLNRTPNGVHDAQRGVAVGHGVRNYAERYEIVNLVEVPSKRLVPLQLSKSGVEVLRPAQHQGVDTARGQSGGNGAACLFRVRFALHAFPVDKPRYRLIFTRVQEAKRLVFKPPLDVRHAEPVRQRRVDVEGLLGYALSPCLRQVRQRTHVVEPVGQFDHHDADVLGHRYEHLARARRAGLVRRRRRDAGDLVNPLELGHTIHEPGHVVPEFVFECLQLNAAVLYDIVHQGRRDGRGVHLQLGQ